MAAQEPSAGNDWPRHTRTIHVRIRTFGKAPAKHGRNAVKVSIADRPFLVRAGWEHLVRATTTNSFVLPAIPQQKIP